MEKLLLFYLRYFPLEIGKKRLSAMLKFNQNRAQFVYTNPKGLKFNIDLSEYVMRQIYLFGIYEKPFVNFLSSLPASNISNILDIGANIGNYTVALTRAFPSASIHSFEPNSKNLERLKANIILNDFKNIYVNAFGLSDKQGNLKLYFDKKNMGAASIANEAGDEFEEIFTDTLDNYCEKQKISNLDLLKMDIEGGELYCLKGGVNMLTKSTKSILQIEIDTGHCNRLGYTPEELFRFPLGFGYQAYLMNKFGILSQSTELPKGFIGNVIFKKGC